MVMWGARRTRRQHQLYSSRMNSLYAYHEGPPFDAGVWAGSCVRACVRACVRVYAHVSVGTVQKVFGSGDGLRVEVKLPKPKGKIDAKFEEVRVTRRVVFTCVVCARAGHAISYHLFSLPNTIPFKSAPASLYLLHDRKFSSIPA